MKKIFMAAAVAAAFAAFPASAQLFPASGQLYLGAGVGEAKTDSRDTSYKLYGGYQFNPTWAIELGYNDLGKFRGADIETYTLAAVHTIQLQERWALFGKLGASENRPDAAGTGDNTGLLLGIGVVYSLNKNLGVRLEYEDFGKLSDAGVSRPRGKNVGLSLKYGF